MFRIFIVFATVLVLSVTSTVSYLLFQEKKAKYSTSAAGLKTPHYSVVQPNFSHHHLWSRVLPVVGGAIIDIDGDGVDELFLGGGVRQEDGLFRYENGHFVNITDVVGLVKQGDEATLAAVVVDADSNSRPDLLLSRESGVWLYLNNEERFSGQRLDLDLPPGVSPLAAAVADLNRDGHFDFFLPLSTKPLSILDHFLHLRSKSSVQSRLYINNGDNTFTDVTESAGLNYQGDTLQAIFADMDNDRIEDLVVLTLNGELKFWKNWGNILFEKKDTLLSVTVGAFLGFTVADYNLDGNLDIFLGNTGSTIPPVLLNKVLFPGKDLNPKWMLLRNIKDFHFSDEAANSRLADYELGRGAIFSDLNLDGRMDLVVSQNYPLWPFHHIVPMRMMGRVLLQNEETQFVPVEKMAKVINREFSIAPLIADFNQDGWPDIVYLNLDDTSRVFLSQKGDNGFLRIRMGNSPKSYGALVKVKTYKGEILQRRYLAGKTLCSDSTHDLFFGLEKDKAIEVEVEYLDGSKRHETGVFFNSSVSFE